MGIVWFDTMHSVWLSSTWRGSLWQGLQINPGEIFTFGISAYIFFPRKMKSLFFSGFMQWWMNSNSNSNQLYSLDAHWLIQNKVIHKATNSHITYSTFMLGFSIQTPSPLGNLTHPHYVSNPHIVIRDDWGRSVLLWEVLGHKLGNNWNDHITGRHQVDKLVSFGKRYEIWAYMCYIAEQNVSVIFCLITLH